MASIEHTLQHPLRRVGATSHPASQLAAWLLGFAPVFYLAMSGGGYDIIARSEVGLLVLWTILVGAAFGVLPRSRVATPAWVGLALLGGFFIWTWVATGWSASDERTLGEAARVATYLGFFALGVALVGRGSLRALLYGLASAVALVSALAVLSRLIPSWFPANPVAHLYATSRLEYPFDYADGVGEFAALGLPLLLFVATEAHTLIGRALGAAALPAVVLCLGLTVSRGGILAMVIGVLVFLALMPRRLAALASVAVAAAASTVVMYALLHRPAVRDGFISAGAPGQRHAVLTVLLLSCVGAGASQAGVGALFARRPARTGRRRGWVRPAVATGLVACLAALVIGLVASGADHSLWSDFKKPNGPTNTNQYLRLLSVSGSHRYQYWRAALDAFDSHPWKGVGPGTFEFYWSQHNTLNEFVRNAHSLYIETLAESGIIGLLLIGGFVAFVLLAGGARALRAPPRARSMTATAVAAFAAFAAAASFDWVWQIGAIPIVAMLMAAAALSGSSVRPEERSIAERVVPRLALVAAAIAGAIAIVGPLSSTIDVRKSQAAARAGNYTAALGKAIGAQRAEPGAATPRLQRALVLEQLGQPKPAVEAVRGAETREPTNWRVWLTASRLEAEAGDPQVALADYRRARALNPTSILFRR